MQKFHQCLVRLFASSSNRYKTMQYLKVELGQQQHIQSGKETPTFLSYVFFWLYHCTI